MYCLSEETATKYKSLVLGENKYHRSSYLPADSCNLPWIDNNGERVCPVTKVAFIDNGLEDLLTSNDSYSLSELLSNLAYGNLSAKLLSTIYPKHADASDLLKLAIVLGRKEFNQVGLDQEYVMRMLNVSIRLSEAVYNNGYAYTFVTGKSEMQENLFKYCDFPHECNESIATPKIRKQGLVAYLYRLYEQALFSDGAEVLTMVSPWDKERTLLLTKDDLVRYTNVAAAYIDSNTAPVRFVVLKGAQILAAYSNIYSSTSSCMQNCAPSVFLNYIANPDTVRIIVGLTSKNRISSRRLIYKLQGRDNDWYAGRLYCAEGKYREEASKLFYHDTDMFNMVRLTLPTYGDEDFPKFMDTYNTMYDDSFDMHGFANDTGKMEECKHLYELPAQEAYEDTEYHFVDMTSTPDSAGGEALIHRDNNYRTSFKIPFLYKGNIPIYAKYRYFDDIDTVSFFNGIHMHVDERDDRCSYLDANMKLSYTYGDNNNSTNNLTRFIEELKSSRCSENLDIEALIKQRDNSDVVRGVKMGYLCEAINNEDIVAYADEYCICLHPNESPMLRFKPKMLLDHTEEYLHLGGALYVPKQNIFYVDDGKKCKAYLLNESNQLGRTPIDVQKLRYVDPITRHRSTLDEAGVTDIDTIFPRYKELCSVTGCDSLRIFPTSHYTMREERFSYAGIIAESGGGQSQAIPIRKELVTSLKSFVANARLLSDSAMFSYDTINYPNSVLPRLNLVHLSSKLYGDGQVGLPDQVVLSNHGWIYKVHARRLPDGTIVHKEAYNAIKILNKFNISVVVHDTFNPVTGVPTC